MGTLSSHTLSAISWNQTRIAWVRSEHIGGRVFFLTFEGISCVSCFADEQSGLKGDCIYFTLSGDKSLYVFDMKHDSISVSSPCPELRMPWCAPFSYIPMTKTTVEMTNNNEGRTVTDDENMNVKQSAKEMLMEDGNVEVGWSLFSSLPRELQHLVAAHLTSAVDYMNFRAVCKVATPIQWIELPELTGYYCFEGICFSSVPTSSDCVIFGIGLIDPSSPTAKWYRVGQEDWSDLYIDIVDHYEPFSVSRSNPVYYDGAFYCLSHKGWLGVFDANEKWTVFLNPQHCSSTSQNFMVECDGELLSVFIDDGGNSTIVSKLDRTMMEWVRVKSLLGRMLFLSSATSIAIETQEKKLQNKIFLRESGTRRTAMSCFIP